MLENKAWHAIWVKWVRRGVRWSNRRSFTEVISWLVGWLVDWLSEYLPSGSKGRVIQHKDMG